MPRETDSLLTVQQVLEELGVSRDTWYKWRCAGKTPPCVRLPNGHTRVRRSALDAWLDELSEGADTVAGISRSAPVVVRGGSGSRIRRQGARA